METEQADPSSPSREALLLIAELSRALKSSDEPEALIDSLLGRVAAFFDASAIALLSGVEEGEVCAVWGRLELPAELRTMAERRWKAGRARDDSRPVETEGPWTLLPMSGNGFLAICLEPGRDLRPAERDVALSVGEAVLRLAQRSRGCGSDRRRSLLEEEVFAARLFQTSLFPRWVPVMPGFRVAAAHLAAGDLSGDFCDLLPMEPHTCGILVGDVAGKGIAAALVGGMCRVAVRSQAACSCSPAGVLRRVNRLLHGDLAERTLVAMIYAVVDTETQEIRLARAGQERPLLRRASGVVEVAASGFCLGIDSGAGFDEALEDVTLVLEPGELLLFYTDGLTDAIGPTGAFFDKGRLAATLGKTGALDARSSLEALYQELDSFRSSRGLADDVTLVALERVGR